MRELTVHETTFVSGASAVSSTSGYTALLKSFTSYVSSNGITSDLISYIKSLAPSFGVDASLVTESNIQAVYDAVS